MHGIDHDRGDLVSVVIATHNRPGLLAGAVRSVLEQTYRNLELIVVDDASSAETAEMMGRFRDARIRYLRHAEVRGGSAARNTGIANARGCFIAFLDDDDEWLPQKLACQMERFRENPQAGAVYTGFIWMEHQQRRIVDVQIPKKRGYLFDDLMVGNVIGTPSTVVIRRKCFDGVGFFDEALLSSEDIDMWRRLSGSCYFDYVKTPLMRYGLHGYARVSADHGKVIGGFEAQLAKFADEFEKRPRARSVSYYWIGLHYIKDDPKRAQQALWKAVTAYPLRPNPYPWLALTYLGNLGLYALDLFERYPWRSYTYIRGWFKSRLYGVSRSIA